MLPIFTELHKSIQFPANDAQNDDNRKKDSTITTSAPEGPETSPASSNPSLHHATNRLLSSAQTVVERFHATEQKLLTLGQQHDATMSKSSATVHDDAVLLRKLVADKADAVRRHVDDILAGKLCTKSTKGPAAGGGGQLEASVDLAEEVWERFGVDPYSSSSATAAAKGKEGGGEETKCFDRAVRWVRLMSKTGKVVAYLEGLVEEDEEYDEE